MATEFRSLVNRQYEHDIDWERLKQDFELLKLFNI